MLGFWICVGIWTFFALLSFFIALSKGWGGWSQLLRGFVGGPLAFLEAVGMRSRDMYYDPNALLDPEHIQSWEWTENTRKRYQYPATAPKDRFYGSDAGWTGSGDQDLLWHSEEDILLHHLYTLEYDEDALELLDQLLSIGIKTKAQFSERLFWVVDISACLIPPESLFAEYFWSKVLHHDNPLEDSEQFWVERLSRSFLFLRTLDNAYFFRRCLD